MKPISSKLANRLDAHFLACTAAIGATVAIAPQEADATIIYSGPISISVPANIDGVYLNFVTGLTGFTGATTPGWDFNPFQSGGTSLAFFWNNTPNPGGGVATATTGGQYITLSLGTIVGAGSVFTNITAATAGAQFQAGGTNFIGVRFTNEQTSQVNFGWVQLSTTGATGFPATIIAYGYENSGGSIAVGAVPEPSTYATLGLLALGAFGVRQWKRAARAA